MKQHFTIFFLTFTSIALGQNNTTNYSLVLDSILQVTEEISYYADTVDWKKIRTEAHLISPNPSTVDDLAPACEYILNQLGDRHGGIRRTSDYSYLAHFTDYKNKSKTEDREFSQEHYQIVNDLDARFEYELLANNIAYLKVVGIGPNVDGQKEAERIRTAISEFHEQKIEKWIIDLRFNGGGNINVMMAGLAPLFDSTEVMNVLDKNKEIQIRAEIKNNNFYYGQVNAFPLLDNTKLLNPKIAILTSRWTVSSGEIVAVAFKGQKDTKFFGERTGGLTTNNSWNIINDEIIVVISTGIYCDRNNVPYPNYVDIDQAIEFEIDLDKSKDKAINAASNWLLGLE